MGKAWGRCITGKNSMVIDRPGPSSLALRLAQPNSYHGIHYASFLHEFSLTGKSKSNLHRSHGYLNASSKGGMWN